MKKKHIISQYGRIRVIVTEDDPELLIIEERWLFWWVHLLSFYNRKTGIEFKD